MSGKRSKSAIGRRAVVFACLIAGGCAVNPDISPTYIQSDYLRRVHAGTAELSCQSPGCAFQYGYNRSALRKHYDDGDWQALSMKVAMLNYRVDQAYYYLGRAAEGMGDLEAALIFYRQSLAITRGTESGVHCNGTILDNCDGIFLPRETVARIDAVERAVTARVPQPTQVRSDPPVQSPPPKAKRAKAKKKPSDGDVVGY